MGVVELDGGLVGQIRQVRVFLQVPAYEILQRGGGEEIFLAQPQLLAGRRRVRGVEHLGDGFRLDAIRHGADVVALVEGVEPEGVAGAGRPQAQRVHVVTAPAHHRRVVGDRFHGLGREPLGMRGALGLAGLDMAAEADVIGDLRPGELPGVAEGQPVLGIFLLPAVLDDLAEEAVLVADAVAVGRYRQGRHAFHEAGGEPAEAAVAERRVGFDLAQRVEVDAQARQGLAHRLGQAEVGQRVEHQAADQELQRHVVDALGAARVCRVIGPLPALHDAIADRQRGGEEPVAGTGVRLDLADRIGELGHHGAAQRFDAAARAQVVIGRPREET